jgi:foldase protein PrsA
VKIAAARRRTFLLRAIIVLLLTATFSACGLITDEDRIKIAQIGDRAITRGDLDLHIASLPIEQKREYMGARARVPTKEVKLRILDELILRELLQMEADKRGIEVTDEEVDNEMQRRGLGAMSSEALEEYGGGGEVHDHEQEAMRRDIAQELRIAKLRSQVLSPLLRMSDEEVRTHYEANKSRYAMIDRVRIRFATCTTMEDAQKILDRVHAGESFADIVATIQEETEGKAAQEWPEAVYMPLGGMRPPQLRDKLMQAEPGELIGPIEREDGFDIVQLIDRQPPARDALRNTVIRDLLATTWNDFVAQLKQEYEVRVFADKVPEDRPY